MRLLLYALPLALLCAGLALLHGIFGRERDEALRALEDRDRAVARSAEESLRARLGARLEAGREALGRAVEDPLQDDGPFLLIRGGAQVLPRSAAHRPKDGGPGKALWDLLEASGPLAAAAREAEGEGTGDGAPMAERLRRIDAFLRALEKGGQAEVEQTFRALLAHRALYQVPAAKDAAATLWVLERFAGTGKADPALLHGLLRDGVKGERGAHLVGLQRVLLGRREQFEAEDFAWLASKLQRLSEKAGVDADDFAQRAAAPVPTRIPLELPVQEPQLAYGYYMEAEGPAGARGTRVELAAELERVTAELRTLGLLAADDALTVPVPQAPVGVRALGVTLSSPGAGEARARVRARHSLKSGLLLGSALLGVGFVAFAALAHSRKRRLVALRGQLLATVSHELRTPLSAIRVMAETLERRAAGAPGVGDYPARIVNEADALGRLVENILAFNRLEKGRLTARPESLPLRELVERVAEDVRACAPARLRLDAAGVGELHVRADPELLRILFSNLLHNACRHGGRDEVAVTVWADARADRVTVSVRDDGGGIPEADWERVFDEFERLPAARAQAKGGSGLGLAICRRIVRLHLGELRVAASGPEGTTFELGLPP